MMHFEQRMRRLLDALRSWILNFEFCQMRTEVSMFFSSRLQTPDSKTWELRRSLQFTWTCLELLALLESSFRRFLQLKSFLFTRTFMSNCVWSSESVKKHGAIQKLQLLTSTSKLTTQSLRLSKLRAHLVAVIFLNESLYLLLNLKLFAIESVDLCGNLIKCSWISSKRLAGKTLNAKTPLRWLHAKHISVSCPHSLCSRSSPKCASNGTRLNPADCWICTLLFEFAIHFCNCSGLPEVPPKPITHMPNS